MFQLAFCDQLDLRLYRHTRRRLLKPGGIVMPDLAELFVAGIDDRDYLMASKQQVERA